MRVAPGYEPKGRSSTLPGRAIFPPIVLALFAKTAKNAAPCVSV